MSSPWNRMRPTVGRSTPVRQLKNVLLPAPFGPMMARISPRRISKSTLLSAVNPPKRIVRPSVRSTGAGAPSRVLAGKVASIVEASANLESIPFLRNRDGLPIHALAHVLVGEPVPTSPEHALGRGELAGCREDRLVLVHHLEDLEFAALHLEDELAQKRLVVL